MAHDDTHARNAAVAEIGNHRFVMHDGLVYRVRAARRSGVCVYYEPIDGSAWRLEVDARSFGTHVEHRSECMVCLDVLDEATAVVVCENGRGCLHGYCIGCVPHPSWALRGRRVLFCIACNSNRIVT